MRQEEHLEAARNQQRVLVKEKEEEKEEEEEEKEKEKEKENEKEKEKEKEKPRTFYSPSVAFSNSDTATLNSTAHAASVPGIFLLSHHTGCHDRSRGGS